MMTVKKNTNNKMQKWNTWSKQEKYPFFSLLHLNVQKVIMIRRIGQTHKLPIEKSLTFPNNNKFYHFLDLL